MIPLRVRDRIRFLKHPHYSFLRFCIKLRSRSRILTGPFSGMSFDVPNFNTAMLLGTWEMELTETIAEFKEFNPSAIICIGAAEGYYAVGLALNFPKLKIDAFEQDIIYRNFLRDLTEKNQCTNINILGKCDGQTLAKTLSKSGGTPLIICDIEGGEIDLLCIHDVPQLKSSFILVEVHEMYVEDCEKILLDRFSQTHVSRVIKGKVRGKKDIPHEIRWLSLISKKSSLIALMNEGRPYPMNWILFCPIKQTP